MLTWIREKFGTVLIGGIIGLLALVFGVYGIFVPKGSRGGSGAEAGSVNGDPIPLGEFNRAYQQRIEMFKGMMGGANLSPQMLKQFRIKEGVMQELVRKKLMLQEAMRTGMMASDEEVRNRIEQFKEFQVNGQFDLATYKRILEANQYTPGSFERMMRDEASVAKWEDYFRDRVHVSDDEVKKQFLTNEDKRDIKYMLFTTEAGRRDVKVDPKDVQKFLADPSKVNIAKGQFEQKKNTEYKGKTFDQVKEQLARDTLAGDHVDEVRKINEKLADEVLPLLTAEKSSKNSAKNSSDAKLDKLMKAYGVEVKTTGFVSRANPYIPGIGESEELQKDLWASPSPIDATHGGKAKKYVSAAWVLVALVNESQNPDLAKLADSRDTIIRQIVVRKERDIMDAWTRKLMEHAKIDVNPSVMADSDDES